MSTILEASHLSKTYRNGHRAVADVSFDIERGRTLGIVGESGCGKSTTAKMVLGLLPVDAGTVSVAGSVVRTRRDRVAARKVLQFVPQNPRTSFNPRMTVGQSLAFNLASQHWPRAERSRQIERILDLVGLTDRHRDSYPHELSGGQLQRGAIARALVTDPQVVVCDEAVSALDKSVQAQVLNLLSDLQRELGVAYLFISHDLDVVEHMSDELVVMLAGEVVERGDAREIYEHPTHPYTATLLRSIPGRSVVQTP